MMKTCFISAPAGIDLSVLTDSLKLHGYRVVAPGSIAAGQKWLDALSDGIVKADLVVGVLDGKHGRANVAFELGCAAALRKQVMVLVSPDADDIPFAVSSLLVVRAEATAREAIDFALDNVPDSPVVEEARPASTSHALSPSVLVDQYVAQMRAARSEEERAQVFRQIFLDARVEVVANARVGHREADFAIWSDDLGAYVGNPLIIEVKHDLPGPNDVSRALAQLTNYLHAASAPWGLLIYDTGPEQTIVEAQASGAARVLVISTESLLTRLRTSSFVTIVRELRNKKVHGVSG
jgi:hypothetical protein